jgi:tetratricopeptide (TPR) repeat protein
LGNASDGAELFSSVATSVFSIQIPAAVVAMQFRITDVAAREFSRSFYSQLALGRAVDDAMTSARAQVRRKIKGSPEWATPVLYLGTTDGDFLGLRLPFEELLSHSLTQLREANWDIAKSTAILAQEQHSEADLVATRKVIVLADQCEQFTETYSQVLKVLNRGGGDYPVLAIEKLIKLAPKLQSEEFTQALGSDLGKCKDVVHMADVIAAFGRQEFEAVIKLCEQAPSNDLFDFSQLKEQALAEREDQIELLRLEKLWSDGDWNVVIEAAERPSSRLTLKRTLAQEKIEAKRHVARDLRRAVDALKHNDFKRAQSLMAGISVADAPANFEFSKRAIDSCVEVAECSDPAAMLVLKYQVENLLAEVDQTSFPETPGVEELRKLMAEIGSEMDYREALDLYSRGYFTKSREIFARFSTYKDSADKAARCEEWIAVIEKLKTRQWDEAKRLLGNLRTTDKSPRVLSYLRWCNWARTVIPVLETMAASSLVIDPMIPWEGGDNPYEVFAPRGISPTSKMEECSDLGFEVRSREERNAWDTLRLVNKRLLVDLLLYTVRNQDVARSLAERLSNVEEGKEKELRIVTTQELVSQLKEDAGIFLVLRKDYDQAIAFFLQEASARPYDATSLHHLGVAAAARIHLVEEQGGDDDQLAQAWEYLILGWAAVFANDTFWHDWWATRRRIYGCPISSQQIDDARLQLQRLWLERIRSATDICPGLDITFRAELNGAMAINGGKGVPLAEHPGELAVVGLFGATTLGLLDAVANWTASFDVGDIQPERWQGRVCEYFSELAQPLALFQDGRYEEAIDRLSRSRCELFRRNDADCKLHVANETYPKVADSSCVCFAGANPGFSKLPRGGELLLARAYDLIESAYCKVGLAAVSSTPADNVKALHHWKTAVELARRHGTTEEILTSIRDHILGRANFLVSSLDTEDAKGCLDILNDVVELLQLSYDERWDNADKALKFGLIDHLLFRAYFLSNSLEDHEGARRDAIQAYVMEPEYLRAIFVLCKVNWFYAWRLHDRGQKSLAEALIKELEQRLHDGDQLFPDNPELASCHKDLQDIRDYIAEVKELNLEDLIRSAPLRSETTIEQQKLSKLAEASVNEAQKRFAEAVKVYDAILEADPDNDEVKARLAYCYNAWIHHESDSAFESPDKIREITQEAIRRFPNSDLFTGFAKATEE